MSHIRSLSVERCVSHAERPAESLAYAATVSPLFDLLADISNAFSLLVYRKKFEPIPG